VPWSSWRRCQARRWSHRVKCGRGLGADMVVVWGSVDEQWDCGEGSECWVAEGMALVRDCTGCVDAVGPGRIGGRRANWL